ncbi:cytochrome P450 [Streptomyces sp. M41]|uniref:cytochrome P450 family protein n=1 Tax=Streptomyces sp. M41 TaxID=3059412 RepID=UPI00374CA3E8
MTLFDRALIEAPTAVYARLRDAAAVHHTSTPDNEPVWVITRYREARAALADGRLSLDKANARVGGAYQSSMPPELDAHLLNMDPPDHTRLRRLISRAFTPRRIEALRDRIQAMADALVVTQTGLTQTGHTQTGPTQTAPHIDLMQALALPLPMGVICELLGIPAGNHHDFRAWTDTLLSPAPGSAGDSRAAMRQMHEFLTGVIQDKRDHPADDLLSVLTHARDDGEFLTEQELLSLAFLTLFAGYDNAVHLIGNAVLGLLLHPQLMDQVRRRSMPIRAVIEETLRWNPPFPLGVRRFALEDVAVGDTVIPAGGRVWISIASANRDEREFPAPGDFVAGRPTAHLAFGHGIHYCLGAPLARLEAEIAIGSLLDHFPTLELAVPVEELSWWPSFNKRGLRSLPVRTRPLESGLG